MITFRFFKLDLWKILFPTCLFLFLPIMVSQATEFKPFLFQEDDEAFNHSTLPSASFEMQTLGGTRSGIILFLENQPVLRGGPGGDYEDDALREAEEAPINDAWIAILLLSFGYALCQTIGKRKRNKQFVSPITLKSEYNEYYF